MMLHLTRFLRSSQVSVSELIRMVASILRICCLGLQFRYGSGNSGTHSSFSSDCFCSSVLVSQGSTDESPCLRHSSGSTVKKFL